MASTRKTTPTKIRTAAGHVQTYHVATGPEPREAVTPLTKTEPVTLAPALADAETAIPGIRFEPAEAPTTSRVKVTRYRDGDVMTHTLDGHLRHSEDDQPSWLWYDGAKGWHRYDLLHRFGGPAKIYYGDGGESWYENGLLHRDYGPAERIYGIPKFWVHGVQYTDQSAADIATAATIERDQQYNNGELERDPETRLARQSDTIDPRATARKIATRKAAAEDPRSSPETLDLLLRDKNLDVRAAANSALSMRNRWRLYIAREAAGEGGAA